MSTVEIALPPLRERGEDIHLLFRKFASDFAHKYKMPPIRLDDEAANYLVKYRWDGNIRQLRNVAEQISVLETNRVVTLPLLQSYLPVNHDKQLPSLINTKKADSDFSSEREILYKILFDMRNDINDLKKLTLELMENDNNHVQETNKGLIKRIYGQEDNTSLSDVKDSNVNVEIYPVDPHAFGNDDDDDEGTYLLAETIDDQESLRLDEQEIELIKRALERNDGRRKAAADELGISERTLYRKIKQFNL